MKNSSFRELIPRELIIAGPLMFSVTATLIVWLISPNLGDLQAAIAREEAAHAGVGLGYWFGWYGGTSPGSYSILVPQISQWLSSFGLLCLSTIIIGGLGYFLATGAQQRLATAWAIALGGVLNLCSGRVAFAFGAAAALIAIAIVKVAVQQSNSYGKRSLFLVATFVMVLSGLGSPLVPVFVGMVALPLLFSDRTRTEAIFATAVAAAAGFGIPVIFFDAAGVQGFPATSLLWILLMAGGAIYAIHDKPQIYIVLVAIVAAVLLFFIPTGVGSNISRFFTLVVPVLILYFSKKTLKKVALALIPIISYAGFVAFADLVAATDSRYEPVIAEVQRLPGLDNHRVEMVDTSSHVGSHILGAKVKLARGWENQTDTRNNQLFYTPEALTPNSYVQWLHENAVKYLVVATIPWRQQRAEADLINNGLNYLTRRWQNGDWTIFEVKNATSIVAPPLKLISESPSRVVIYVPDTRPYPLAFRPGKYLVAYRDDKNKVKACITETATGWIAIQVNTPGNYILEGHFSIGGGDNPVIDNKCVTTQ